jgi:hypothetical protein
MTGATASHCYVSRTLSEPTEDAKPFDSMLNRLYAINREPRSAGLRIA